MRALHSLGDYAGSLYVSVTRARKAAFSLLLKTTMYNKQALYVKRAR
jgi:hypothetical protein